MDSEWTLIELVLDNAKKHNTQISTEALRRWVEELSTVNSNFASLALVEFYRDYPVTAGMPTIDQILSRAIRLERQGVTDEDDDFDTEIEETKKTTAPFKQNHGANRRKQKR
jgi:hypothetical protein